MQLNQHTVSISFLVCYNTIFVMCFLRLNECNQLPYYFFHASNYMQNMYICMCSRPHKSCTVHIGKARTNASTHPNTHTHTHTHTGGEGGGAFAGAFYEDGVRSEVRG